MGRGGGQAQGREWETGKHGRRAQLATPPSAPPAPHLRAAQAKLSRRVGQGQHAVQLSGGLAGGRQLAPRLAQPPRQLRGDGSLQVLFSLAGDSGGRTETLLQVTCGASPLAYRQQQLGLRGRPGGRLAPRARGSPACGAARRRTARRGRAWRRSGSSSPAPPADADRVDALRSERSWTAGTRSGAPDPAAPLQQPAHTPPQARRPPTSALPQPSKAKA